MRTHRSLFVLAVALLLPSFAVAQDTPRTLTQMIIGGGPFAPHATGATPVYFVGFEITPAASRVTWRLATEYWASSYGNYDQQGVWGESNTFGIQALGVRTFGRGRIRPYFFGGAGLYSTQSFGVGRQFFQTDSGIYLGRRFPYTRSEVEPALLWGPGLNLRVFRLNTFGEVRMPLFLAGPSIRIGPQAPFIFGIRF
jgi:hypothetical protein